MTDQDIRKKSQQQAEIRPGRVQLGALVAVASNLRKIRVDGQADKQVVFIYDDPKPSDPWHSIIRIADTLGRPDQDDVRNKIRQQFSVVITP